MFTNSLVPQTPLQQFRGKRGLVTSSDRSGITYMYITECKLCKFSSADFKSGDLIGCTTFLNLGNSLHAMLPEVGSGAQD